MSYPPGIKPDALVPIEILSIYNQHSALLPSRMAYLVPDGAQSLADAAAEYSSESNGTLYLSDAFRSFIAQAQAHIDYLAGHHMTAQINVFLSLHPELVGYTPHPKRAYSPPPGGSMHEAGRAIDVDLDAHWSKTPPEVLRDTLVKYGWTTIADIGDLESWHLEFRGDFQSVYDAVMQEGGTAKMAYRAMVEAAIADIQEG